MSYEILKTFFMWSTIIHFSILMLWVILLKFANDRFRKLQEWWFPLPKENFMSLNYLMYGLYKLMALVFSAVPYMVLIIMGK